MAETNAPPKVSHGFHAWAFNRLQTRAGGAVPSPDRIARLRDLDGDGIAETRRTVLLGVHSPFGMTLVDTVVFVATDDAILQFPFRTVMIDITGQKVCSRRSMGSARTSASAPTATRARTASRTRPISRVELGRDLVPDYITAVHDGGLLWMAIQRLRNASQLACEAAATAACIVSDRAGLRAPSTLGLAGPARFVGSPAAQWLQGHLRSLSRPQTRGATRRCTARFRE